MEYPKIVINRKKITLKNFNFFLSSLDQIKSKVITKIYVYNCESEKAILLDCSYIFSFLHVVYEYNKQVQM